MILITNILPELFFKCIYKKCGTVTIQKSAKIVIIK